jgi:hypothetical protein
MVAIEESEETRARRVIIAPARPVGRARRQSPPIALPRLQIPSLRFAWTVPREQSAEVSDASSPTTSIRHVLIVLVVGFLLASVFGARGLVHSGQGMNLGIERAVTLGIGRPLLAVTGALRLTWPWDTAEHLLGRCPPVPHPTGRQRRPERTRRPVPRPPRHRCRQSLRPYSCPLRGIRFAYWSRVTH